MSRSAAPARSKAGWEHFPHDADVGVRGPGATAAEAFEQAAHALTAVITHAEVEPQRSVEVRCKAPDIELSIEALLCVSKIRFFNICDEGRQDRMCGAPQSGFARLISPISLRSSPRLSVSAAEFGAILIACAG